MTRYVIIGAGAVGVTFAEALHRAGADVLLVARGRQLAALREHRLRLVRPDGTTDVTVPYAGGPDEVTLTGDDALVLAVKSQDTERTVAEWAWQPVTRHDGGRSTAAAELPVVVPQNGLESERIALRRFADVLGASVWVPAVYVEEGVVISPAAPTPAALWIGRYPAGADHPLLGRLAADLRAADFAVRVVPDIIGWKTAKLIGNTVNGLEALYRPGALRDAAAALLAEEARDVLAAAGLPVADRDAPGGPDLSGLTLHDIPGFPRGGNSTWQSVARAGSLEVDHLNGEIVLQARLAGRTAPANSAVVARLRRAVREGTPAGSLGDADLAATVPGLPPRVLISAPDLRAETAGDHPPVLLDVRWALGDPDGRGHYRRGHIPSAVYADLDTELAAPATPAAGRHPLPDPAALQQAARRWGITADRPVVVYDDAGGLAAARAWWLLRWAGVADVRILDGSLAAWRAIGGPLAEGDETAAAPGDIVLAPGRLPVLTADQAAGLPRHGVLLDARAGERYRGETEPVDPRAGHIPGAISAPTAENLDGAGRFTGVEETRKRFAVLGAGDGRPVGVYCGSGVTAAHQIAALANAGIEAALYPGSWSAWSADPLRPVATGPEPGGAGPEPGRTGSEPGGADDRHAPSVPETLGGER
ncbi:rhodanese-like domain-containing protein [Streptomyces sp. NBC_01476]|uniref:rhodanese-like domain-containing protein n=1 Tax=Streptomyces sp. NBC_01476 TaxID=2903881 RepID=UPI003FCCCD2D